jgi:aspartate carbamoyltransferase regulatory subunit
MGIYIYIRLNSYNTRVLIINLFFSKEKYFKKINKSINKYLKKLREREISIYKPENTFLFTPHYTTQAQKP